MLRHQDGYTLTELVVVLAIFGIVMTLTTTSFNRIVATSGQTIRSAESEIEGLIGLEVLRSDLELAGYGLPWAFQNSILYSEVNASVTPAAQFNDAPGNPPRAIVSGNGIGFNGSDYLVLKGIPLGTSQSSRLSSYMTYGSSTQPAVKAYKPETDLVQVPQCRDPDTGSTVIALNSTSKAGVLTKELVMDGASYSFCFVQDFEHIPFKPRTATDNYLVYGVAGGAASLVAPFNRADYYIFRPEPDQLSTRCAPNTGVLYKGVMNHGGVKLNTFPLLDCVADLQVIYGFTQDSRLDRTIDLHEDEVPDANGLKPSDGGHTTAYDIRRQLREVRVYILAHEGKKDRTYVYPASTVKVGDFGHGKDVGRDTAPFDLKTVIGSGCPEQERDCWQHYRWKVYTIAVDPKNLR